MLHNLLIIDDYIIKQKITELVRKGWRKQSNKKEVKKHKLWNDTYVVQ